MTRFGQALSVLKTHKALSLTYCFCAVLLLALFRTGLIAVGQQGGKGAASSLDALAGVGVMVLFVFVIMVVGGGRNTDDVKPASAPRMLAATVIVFVIGGAIVLGARMAQPAFELRPGPKAAVVAGRERAGLSRNTEDVGTDLYSRAALPFEVASLVLLVAIVGAVVLAKGRKVEQED